MNPEDLATNFLSILQDGDFLLEISKKQSIDEVREEFSKKGCDLTNEQAEFIQEKVKGILSGKVKITEQDLEDVSGGKINISVERVLIVIMGITLALSLGGLVGSSFKSSAPPKNQEVNEVVNNLSKLANSSTARTFIGNVVSGTARVYKQPWYSRLIYDITGGTWCRPNMGQVFLQAAEETKNSKS